MDVELDLRLLRYAIAVGEELHFGRAATRLFISEQTLSAQIKLFETRLGVSLFERNRRHVELTPAGELLLVRGRALLAAANDLLHEIVRYPPPLRVDMLTEGLATANWIVERLSTGPEGMALQISQGQGLASSLTRLASGELDLAIGRAWSAGHRLPVAFQTMLVRLDPVGVMLPAHHALADRPAIRMADLADVPLLVFSPVEAAEWQNWQEELAAAFGLQAATVVHGQGPAAARSALRTYGQAQLCTLEHPPAAGIVFRPLVDPVPVYPWSVVWRDGHRDGRLEQALLLIAELAERKGWLASPPGRWWVPESDRKEWTYPATGDVGPAGDAEACGGAIPAAAGVRRAHAGDGSAPCIDTLSKDFRRCAMEALRGRDKFPARSAGCSDR
jgi:DNA-binding transcriptional LysR family regulator